MAIQHGVNFTASDMAQLVQQGSDASGKKSWETLYGNAGLNYQAQSDALLKSYGDTIAEAYKASLQQQNALYDFGLSANDTHDLQNIARQDLMTTYQNYLANYQQAQQNIADAYIEQKGLYDEALMTESENFANLYNYAMDYYENVLKNATWTRDDTTKPIYEGEGKEAVMTDDFEQKTTSLVDDYGLDWLMKENDDKTLIPLERDELMNVLFDKEGVLTENGRHFYDMIFNNAAYKNYVDAEGNLVTSFDEWLSTNDNDLYNWLKSEDTFNYTRQGTKFGTAKTFVGLESDDEKFVPYQSIDGLISDTDVSINTLRDTLINDESIKDANEAYQKAMDKLNKKSADRNNISGRIGAYMTYAQNDFNTYRDALKNASSDTLNNIYEQFDMALKGAVDDEIYDKYSAELKAALDKAISAYDIKLEVPTDYVINAKNSKNVGVIYQFKDDVAKAYESLQNIPDEFYTELQAIAKKMYTEQSNKNANVSGR